MKLLACALMLAALSACASSAEDDRTEAVIQRASFLFQHYGEAIKKQDAQMISVVKGDLRKLNSESMSVLLVALAKNDQELQGYAAFALGFSANRAAIVPLESATRHADETVRGNAIAALGQLGFADLPGEPFRRLLQDAVPEVRQAALYGLSNVLSDKTDLGLLDAVHAALEDPDLNVRNEALIVLRRMRRKDSVAPILANSIKDPEPRVRASAAQALGAIGRDAKDATPFLIELLKDEYHRPVDAAWSALNRIHDKDLDRSYSTWRDWYEDEQKVHYTCLEHKEISELNPGLCPKCKNRLERITKDGVVRKPPVDSALPTGLFACPEHPEIVTTTASKCGKPGCGKDLVPRKPDPVTYTCPEHPEILTTSPSKCGKPGCGKDLVPKK